MCNHGKVNGQPGGNWIELDRHLLMLTKSKPRLLCGTADGDSQVWRKPISAACHVRANGSLGSCLQLNSRGGVSCSLFLDGEEGVVGVDGDFFRPEREGYARVDGARPGNANETGQK